MKHDPATAEAIERAALYAAGALPEDQRRAFEAHLAEGCPECQAELDSFGPAVSALARLPKPAAPPERTRAALLERVTADARSPAASPLRRQVAEAASEGQALITRRAADAAWQDGDIPGVRVRVLHSDPNRDQFTALVRMAPGTSYPRHVHRGPEECLVLEGDLHVGADVLRPGDYQRAPEGSRHGVQRTEGGCLLLITSSLSDVFE